MSRFATGRVGGAAGEVRNSKALEQGIRVGLVSYGVVHLLIGWLALQLAWTHHSGAANSTGALRALSGDPLGSVLLWVVGLGLVALVIWQGGEAIWGYREDDGAKRMLHRVTSGVRAVIYGVLAFSAFRIVTGSGQGGSSSSDSLTSQVMKMTGGQLLVGLIGLIIVAVGIALVVRGITKAFTKRLGPRATSGTSGNVVVRLGQAGYAAKGVSLGVVGALFVWAAWTFDPKKAGGLDAALQTLLNQAYGAWLLTLVALGIACFGFYCFAWARDPRL